MNTLQKIQNLPKGKRKIILWAVMIVLAGVMIFFYVKNVQKKLSSLDKEKIQKQINFPDIGQELKVLENIKIPDVKDLVPNEENKQ